ncbi:hypothetical protein BsWGS_13907 [Bradybaena similaris]
MASSSHVMTVGGSGAGFGPLLSHLTMETELQRLLAEEKSRAEEHKINYQRLKIEYTRLQDKILELEAENKSTIEESKIVKDKYLAMYEACKRELAERLAEIEDMKTRMISASRLELIKSEVASEIEKTFKEKAKKQEAEVEEYRLAVNKLRYELSFLKSEYEHEQGEHRKHMEDLVKQHEIEVSNLRQDRDSTIARVLTETGQDKQKVMVLQRDNVQLHIQVKELLAELEEIRALREKSGLDSDNIARTQSKQLTEHKITIRTLEAERESLKRQLENLQREMVALTAESTSLKGDIHELEKKNTILKGHAEQVNHRSKVDVYDLKMEMLKQMRELEKERDTLKNVVEDLKSQLDIADSKIGKLQQMLEDKEREIVHRVQSAREEEFSKMAKIESEKFDLETRLQELERRRIDDDSRHHQELEKQQERVSQANASREEAERELFGVRTRLSHMENLQSELERERSENSSLKTQVHRLESELMSFRGADNELADSNVRLKNNAELLREELKIAVSQLDKLKNEHEITLIQQRSALAEHRMQLEQRVHELEAKLGQAHSKYTRASAIHKKLKKKTVRVTDHLKEKVMLLKAQNTELDLEKQALQKCVPAEKYNRLQKQWKNLWRRHQEFRAILFSVPSNITVTNFSQENKVQDISILLNQSAFDNELEERHQEDLKVLRTRLEALDKAQHQQFLELADLSTTEKQDHEKEVTKLSFGDQVSVKSSES